MLIKHVSHLLCDLKVAFSFWLHETISFQVKRDVTLNPCLYKQLFQFRREHVEFLTRGPQSES